jgi:hypothetical protein
MLLIKITKEEAERLIKEAGHTDHKEMVEFAKDVSSIHVGEGVHITYLRADQGTGQEGYHADIPSINQG